MVERLKTAKYPPLADEIFRNWELGLAIEGM
jgi:hypothetical protein